MDLEISRRRAGLAGVLAAAVGLGAAELVGALLGVRQTPVLAVGSAFIDIVPPWLKDLAIELFGTADKVVLIIGILLVSGAVAAGIGLLSVHQQLFGRLAIGAIAVVAAVIAVARPHTSVLAALPALAAGLIAAVLMPILLARFGRTGARSAEPLARRKLLASSGLLLLGSALATGVGRWWGGQRTGVEEARTAVRVPGSAERATRVPPGAALSVEGLARWRTPNSTFYRIDTALSEPLIDPGDWRLRVHGMVDHPLTLTFADMQRRTIVHRWVTLACVSNQIGGSLVGNALWTGVRLDELLREVGVHRDADAVKSTSEDGWTCGTPLTALTDGRDSMLAFAMNGRPLPLEHGFPVRMVVPGLYGFVSATKWVVDLEVTRFDRFQAYWTTRGWSARAPIKTASRIDVPRDQVTVPAGPVTVAGVAWAQRRGISGLELRVDDEPWREVRLAGQPTKDSWRQWRYEWEAAPGTHRLQVRATDGTGETQTAAMAPPAPDGASGYHTITVTVG